MGNFEDFFNSVSDDYYQMQDEIVKSHITDGKAVSPLELAKIVIQISTECTFEILSRYHEWVSDPTENLGQFE